MSSICQRGRAVSCCSWWKAERNCYAGELAHEQTLSIAQRCREPCGSNIMPHQALILANGERSENFVPGLEQKSSCFGEDLHGPEAMEALHRSGAGPVPPVSPCTHMFVVTITYLPFLQQAAKMKGGLFDSAGGAWEYIPPATQEHFCTPSWTVWVRKRVSNEHISGDLQVLRRP